MRTHDTPCAAPAIETERLILRAHRTADYADCVALWADPVVTRYIGGKPFSPAQTWSKMLCYAGLWQLVGYGYWAIEEKASSRCVGELGFADFKRDITPSLEGLPEFGWVLRSTVHRRGYGSEAVRAALAWSDVHFSGGATACIINPDNVASLRLAASVGYRESARTSYSGVPVHVFRR